VRFSGKFYHVLAHLNFSPFSLCRTMARTKEDVASKGDASPRIPKSSAGVTKNTAEAPVKRGRGRPPKGAAPMPKKVYVPTGRPRGRPPGSGKKTTAGPKKVAAVNDDGTPKQGRGRPRRAASGTESAATTPKDGKKRGRKPKAADVSEDEETKHDEPGKEFLQSAK
jgi:high mobility group AT-hook protein 2